MPAKPELTLPRADSSGLDHRRQIVMKHAGIEPTVPPIRWRVKLAPTTVVAGGWTNSSRIATGNGNQNNLASATASGPTAIVDWDSATVGAVQATYRVVAPRFFLDFMARWSSAMDRPGDIAIRGILTFKGIEKYEGLFRMELGDPLAGSPPSTPVPASGNVRLTTRYRGLDAVDDLVVVFEDIMGAHNFSVQDVIDLGTDLKMSLTAWEGREAWAPEWHIGSLEMVLGFEAEAPTKQGSSLFQIYARDRTTILYNGLKTATPSRYHTVPPDALAHPGGAGPLLISMRVQVWDVPDVASGFSDWVDADMLSLGAASLSHDPGDRHYLGQWEVGPWLSGSGWTLSTSESTVWRKEFDRADQPLTSFDIDGFELEGVDGGFVEILSTAADPLGDCGALAGSWFWDQDGTHAEALNSKPTLFWHAPDGRPPSGYNAAGFQMRLLVYVATKSLHVWGRNYVGLIVSLPRVTRSLDDVVSGRTAAPTGSITWHNPLDDPTDASSVRLWQKLIAHGQPPETGWNIQDRKLSIFAVGQRGAEFVPELGEPPTWEALTHWEGGTVTLEQCSLSLLPLALKTDAIEIGTEAYDQRVYPYINVLQKNEAKPIAECYGVNSGGTLEAVIVDPGPAFGAGPQVIMRAALKSDAINIPTILTGPSGAQLYLGSAPVDGRYYTWTIIDGVGHIVWIDPFDATPDPQAGGRAIGLVSQDFWTANQDGPWRAMAIGDGAAGNVAITAGAVTRKLLEEAGGIPAADIAAGTFTGIRQLDDLVRVAIDGPVRLHDVLFRLMRTGDFALVQGYDSRFRAALINPTELTTGLIIRDYSIIDDPVWRVEAEGLASTATINYPAEVPAYVEEPRQWQARNWRVGPQFGIDRELSPDPETFSFQGVALERVAGHLDRPVKRVPITTTNEAENVWPGDTVVLLLDDALAEGGSADHALCLVEQSSPRIVEGGVDLWLRYLIDLPLAARPGVL